VAVSRTRAVGARFFHRRGDSDPLVAWRRLPSDIRASVIELARRGEPHPYPSVREIAVAWATVTCTVPFLGAWARGVAIWIVFGAGAAAGLGLLVNHDPLFTGLGAAIGGTVGTSGRILLVRARGRRVLRANRAP
jgi:hypothetical protein